MGRPSKWADHLDAIARMAAEGKTDAEIAAVFDSEAANILRVRQYYRIPTNSVRGGVRDPKPAPDTPPPPRQIETVTVDGVTYCSPGWATGATSDHRVKPRRT